MITYIIPCGAEKAPTACAAADLYKGKMFQHTLSYVRKLSEKDIANGEAVQILILSAKYGFLSLDEVVAPYDTKMGAAGSISVEALTEQAEERGLEEVYCFLPKAYYSRVYDAFQPFYGLAHDVYEALLGIGEQRRANVLCAR